MAEAAVCLEAALVAKEKWWEMPADACAILDTTREARGEDHPWTSTVLNFVDGLTEVAISMIFEPAHQPTSGTTRKGLDIPQVQRTRAHSLSIAGILKAHGWTRDGKFTGGPWKGQARYVPVDGCGGTLS